jgi:hypothetical protein
VTARKNGLYANIHAKQERIAHGSGEHMREPGTDGAPSEEDFRKSEKTTKAAKTAKTAKGAKPAKSARKKPGGKH